MSIEQKEAPATASTPEISLKSQHKDNDNKSNIKALKPNFESLTATAIKKHVKDLTKKGEPIQHVDILGKLLESIEPFDFEKAAFPQIEALRKKRIELQNKLTKPDGATNKDVLIETELKEISKQLNSFKLTQQKQIILIIKNVLVIAKLKKWGICKNNDFIYIYNGEYWANIEKEAFQSFLGEAAELMGVDYLDSQWHEFREKLFKQFMAVSYLPKPERKEGVILINLKNGTFEITPTGNKMRPFDSADFLTYQLPFAYEPTAKAPLFDRYLNRVQPDIERQLILSEYLGWVFVPTNYLKLEKALLLYGGGANGKSVFFEVVNALLGYENISQYSLENLTEEKGFYRAKINNKLLNYCSDISSKLNNAIFKQLVSGEPVEACLKYGQPFNMVGYAKLISNCNELPKAAEQTEAFHRRFLIVNFDQTIPEAEQDKQLSKKIIESELSGVFNWVLEGLSRLLIQKGFSPCEAAKQARKDYELESDSVNQFIDSCEYKASATLYSPIVDLYREYRNFCIEDGCPAVKKGNFIKRLKHLNITVNRLNIGNVAYLHKETNPF